jgi:hypothetical protein
VSSISTPGAGLLPARPARAILQGERIHVVGEAGAGAARAEAGSATVAVLGAATLANMLNRGLASDAEPR